MKKSDIFLSIFLAVLIAGGLWGICLSIKGQEQNGAIPADDTLPAPVLMLGLAIILTLLATVLVLAFYRLPDVRKSIILVINAQDNSHAAEIFETVSKYDKSSNVKSRSLTKESADFLIEVRVKDSEGLLNDLNRIQGVSSVSLLAHKGDTAF